MMTRWHGGPDSFDGNTVGVFHIPDYLMLEEEFPVHFSGGMYIIPWTNVACMFHTAMHTPFFPINDAYITGFIAEGCGVKRENDHRILNGG